MKRTVLATLIAALGLSLAPLVRAEVLIEPVVGWSANQNLKFDRDKDYSSGNGLSYGGRLGYQKLGFQVGLDYLKSDIEMGSNDFKENYDVDQWAGFIGFEFPILFRVYGGYIFSSEADSDLDRVKLELEDGSGYKAGLGFTLIPFVDINLEYRRGTYDMAKLGGLETNQDVDFEALMIGLSLPLTF